MVYHLHRILGKETGTLSHTYAAPPALAAPWRPLLGRGLLLPHPGGRTSTPGAPSSSASNFTCATDAPVSDARRPWGQEKLALRSTSLPDPSGGSGLWLRHQPRFGCGG
ncbi:unnamed protein product [Parnassius mnemosyne]|uniref:Uncharacterized protein n=1 Tax=Parnassius mnemosyne TaxID=213953 RepID=A0AAV1LW54_9NEOP